MDRRANVGVALLAVGVLLVANPLSLGHLLPYPTPGDGFRFTGVYHAQLGVLGLVAAHTGAYVLLRSRPMTPRIAGLVAFAAVVGHVAFNRLVAWVSLGALGRDAHDAFGGALVNPLAYPGGEGLFVEFALASLFAVGVVARGAPPGSARRSSSPSARWSRTWPSLAPRWRASADSSCPGSARTCWESR